MLSPPWRGGWAGRGMCSVLCRPHSSTPTPPQPAPHTSRRCHASPLAQPPYSLPPPQRQSPTARARARDGHGRPRARGCGVAAPVLARDMGYPGHSGPGGGWGASQCGGGGRWRAAGAGFGGGRGRIPRAPRLLPLPARPVPLSPHPRGPGVVRLLFPVHHGGGLPDARVWRELPRGTRAASLRGSLCRPAALVFPLPLGSPPPPLGGQNRSQRPATPRPSLHPPPPSLGRRAHCTACGACSSSASACCWAPLSTSLG